MVAKQNEKLQSNTTAENEILQQDWLKKPHV